jgi:N6-adenosine-specific RNA methylase IME4
MIAKARILYADPPWPQNARRNPNTRFGLGVHGHYPTLSWDELKALPVGDIAQPQSVLFLWVTWPHLERCQEVMHAWGFRHTTLGYIWIKTNRRSGTPFFGVGNYTKSNSEPCLLGMRGKPLRPAVNTESSVVFAPRQRHSAKPARVREGIERMYPDGPRVELFARTVAPGWRCLGNEIDGQGMHEALTVLNGALPDARAEERQG